MLTLMPLSGIQDALFKRRNSTTMEQFADRRGSISVYDTYSLPNSKADMRRFSSYEQLAPFFQQILSQQDGAMGRMAPTPAPAPVPTSPSTASTSSGQSPTGLSPLARSRRGSIGRFASALTGSFRKQKSVPVRTQQSETDSDVSCDDLDAKLEEIKGKLAQFRSEDHDMSQRVEDLSNSVDTLYVSSPECWSPSYRQNRHYCHLREHKMTGMSRSNSFQNYRPSLSTSGLKSISENDSELVIGGGGGGGVSRDHEEVEEIPLRPTGHVTLRRSTPVQRSRPSSHASISSISEEPETEKDESTTCSTDTTTDTKSFCLPNNTQRMSPRDRAKSMSQIPHVIRNDLSASSLHLEDTSRKRNSVISIMSDSVLITHRNLPAMRSLLKEHEL